MLSQALKKEWIADFHLDATDEKPKHTLVLLDEPQTGTGMYDVVYKYQNNLGKWAFKWVKKSADMQQEYKSEFEFDEITTASHNTVYFIKDGLKGFWYYNTRTVFFYP